MKYIRTHEMLTTNSFIKGQVYRIDGDDDLYCFIGKYLRSYNFIIIDGDDNDVYLEHITEGELLDGLESVDIDFENYIIKNHIVKLTIDTLKLQISNLEYYNSSSNLIRYTKDFLNKLLSNNLIRDKYEIEDNTIKYNL